jgi:hypothetical protein
MIARAYSPPKIRVLRPSREHSRQMRSWLEGRKGVTQAQARSILEEYNPPVLHHINPIPATDCIALIEDAVLMEQIFGRKFSTKGELTKFIKSRAGKTFIMRMARKGKEIEINGQKVNAFLNIKTSKELIYVRLAFPNGENVVKIFSASNLQEARSTHRSAYQGNKLHIDLSQRKNTEIADILLDFSKVFELSNNVEYFYFSLGNMEAVDLLGFAVANKESDRLRVVQKNGNLVLCLYNKNWNGRIKKVEALRDAEKTEESLGVQLQAAMAYEVENGGVEVRIYTQDQEILSNIKTNRSEIIRQVLKARQELAHLLPSGKAETIRVVLEKGDKRERAGAYYSPDEFRDRSFEYTDNKYCGEKGALIFIKKSHKNDGSYEVNSKEKILIDERSLTAELRHFVSYRIWDSQKREEMAKCGWGLLQAVNEFIDDLRFLYDEKFIRAGQGGSQGDSNSPMASIFHPNNKKDLGNYRSIFEWVSPYDSGHQTLSKKGIYRHENLSKLLKAIDEGIVEFLVKTPRRPISRLFELAIALGIYGSKPKKDFAFKMGMLRFENYEMFDLKLKAVERLLRLCEGYPEVVIDPLSKIFARLGIEKTEGALTEYARNFSSAEGFGSVLEQILSAELGIDVSLLREIGADYYKFFELEREFAKAKGSRKKGEIKEKLESTHQRLRENLLKSPLAYHAPNGKVYATQLEYMLDPHVLESIIDKAIASVES